jgi:rubrerythrin
MRQDPGTRPDPADHWRPAVQSEHGHHNDEDRPGDAVCWLRLVCTECGTIAEEEPPAICPQCGAQIDPYM